MYKLLIVEDETIIRKGLVQAIDWESVGFKVIADAADGKKALICIENELPDVLLTDIRMPIMDGLELMSIVSQKYPTIRQMVLSGYGDFSYAQHAIQCGVVAYILKPTKDDSIYEAFKKVKRLLDGIEMSKPVPQQENRKLFQDPTIIKVVQYIDEKFSEKITLDDVSKIAYMNPTYFSTFFKRKTGESFKDYIVSVRMKKAKELAIETDLKGHFISEMVGYDDPRYFSKLFKEAFGKTIAELRKEMRL